MALYDAEPSKPNPRVISCNPTAVHYVAEWRLRCDNHPHLIIRLLLSLRARTDTKYI